jgi:hypothetical protein
MKTTVDLPAELVRAIKIRAIEENRKLKEMIAELLRRGLAGGASVEQGAAPRRVTLPLVRTAHQAEPDEEMTPERVAAVLADEDSKTVT